MQFLCLTAASGVVPNLEVAVRVAGLRLEQEGLKGRPLGMEVLHAAAEAGQLSTCEWLRQQGQPWDEDVLAAAARGGQLDLCRALREQGCRLAAAALTSAAGCGNAQLVEWLLAEGCPWDEAAAGAAARGGHVGIMDTLLQLHEASPSLHPLDEFSLLQGAALGCGLADLRRVHDWCVARPQGSGSALQPGTGLFSNALVGPTPDWADKVAWLLDEQGTRPASRVAWTD
jgi:hypothetical protein